MEGVGKKLIFDASRCFLSAWPSESHLVLLCSKRSSLYSFYITQWRRYGLGQLRRSSVSQTGSQVETARRNADPRFLFFFSFPVRLPRVEYSVTYDLSGFPYRPNSLSLATGDQIGYTLHSDFLVSRSR